MPRKVNLQNLKVPTSEQARENGRKGGLARQKKRREMETAKSITKMLLSLPLSPQQDKIAAIAESYGIDTTALTQKGLMLLANLLKAQKGDGEATKLLLSLVDELPASKTHTEVSGPGAGPVLVMSAEMTAGAVQRARQIAEELQHGES